MVGASGKPEAVTTGTWTRDELWVPSQRPHEDRFFWGKEKKKKERERRKKKNQLNVLCCEKDSQVNEGPRKKLGEKGLGAGWNGARDLKEDWGDRHHLGSHGGHQQARWQVAPAHHPCPEGSRCLQT